MDTIIEIIIIVLIMYQVYRGKKDAERISKEIYKSKGE